MNMISSSRAPIMALVGGIWWNEQEEAAEAYGRAARGTAGNDQADS